MAYPALSAVIFAVVAMFFHRVESLFYTSVKIYQRSSVKRTEAALLRKDTCRPAGNKSCLK